MEVVEKSFLGKRSQRLWRLLFTTNLSWRKVSYSKLTPYPGSHAGEVVEGRNWANIYKTAEMPQLSVIYEVQCLCGGSKVGLIKRHKHSSWPSRGSGCDKWPFVLEEQSKCVPKELCNFSITGIRTPATIMSIRWSLVVSILAYSCVSLCVRSEVTANR